MYSAVATDSRRSLPVRSSSEVDILSNISVFLFSMLLPLTVHLCFVTLNIGSLKYSIEPVNESSIDRE